MAYSGNSGGLQRRRVRLTNIVRVTDHASAKQAAKIGAAAGFLIAAANALTVVAVVLGLQLLPTPPGRDPHNLALALEWVIFGPFALVTALLSWRVLTGRGYVSAILLTLVVALELVLMFAIRKSDVIYGGILLLKFVIDGVRGTWWLRRHRRDPDPEVFA